MKNVIGRTAIIRDTKQHGELVEAMVIDKNFANRAKRVRILTGEFSGEVRMIHEYELIEFCKHGEAPGFLAAAWVTE
jgi:hypothetical protein